MAFFSAPLMRVARQLNLGNPRSQSLQRAARSASRPSRRLQLSASSKIVSSEKQPCASKMRCSCTHQIPSGYRNRPRVSLPASRSTSAILRRCRCRAHRRPSAAISRRARPASNSSAVVVPVAKRLSNDARAAIGLRPRECCPGGRRSATARSAPARARSRPARSSGSRILSMAAAVSSHADDGLVAERRRRR